MSTQRVKLGWVGFGAMGASMVRRVAAAGHLVHAVVRSSAQKALLEEKIKSEGARS